MCVDCTDGDVRLSMNSEGTVEVCFNRVWGLISENGWTNTDAQVICNQLGHTNDPGYTHIVMDILLLIIG